MLTRVFREQHTRIRQLASELEALNVPDLDAALVRNRLAGLSGAVKSHLAGEDRGFYPALLIHTDPAVRERAGEFQNSMGSLAGAYLAFYETWRASGAIEAGPAAFFAELHGVLEALRVRMDLEDAQLYALADRVLTTV